MSVSKQENRKTEKKEETIDSLLSHSVGIWMLLKFTLPNVIMDSEAKEEEEGDVPCYYDYSFVGIVSGSENTDET